MQGKQIFPVSYLRLLVGFVSGAVWGVAWVLISRLLVYFNLASVLAGTGSAIFRAMVWNATSW